MIIYNVTVNVDEDIAEEFIRWMRDTHIPDVMRCGLFSEWRMLRVLAEEEGGFTYAIQYTCADMSAYERYRDEFAPALQAHTRERYGNRVVAFRTLLEVLE